MIKNKEMPNARAILPAKDSQKSSLFMMPSYLQHSRMRNSRNSGRDKKERGSGKVTTVELAFLWQQVVITFPHCITLYISVSCLRPGSRRPPYPLSAMAATATTAVTTTAETATAVTTTAETATTTSTAETATSTAATATATAVT